MNVFHIIGPIMIGPSSSHTAGAVRLGRVVNKVSNDQPLASVRIELCGSFAKTYQGHGTDRALLAGIMGYHSYSEEIRDALDIATERGISYEFLPKAIPGAHPNTACIHYKTISGEEGCVQGASIGGGNIRVDFINGMEVNFTGENNTILILHQDRPGVIADVTNLIRMKYSDVNIGNFKLSRKEKGSTALMTIEIDQMPPEGLTEELESLKHVERALLIRAV